MRGPRRPGGLELAAKGLRQRGLAHQPEHEVLGGLAVSTSADAERIAA
jgi:hypothetical protein